MCRSRGGGSPMQAAVSTLRLKELARRLLGFAMDCTHPPIVLIARILANALSEIGYPAESLRIVTFLRP
jgi:hypothetical protein